LIDMDGVIVSGRTMIPGADAFIGKYQSARIGVSRVDQ
jgi:ribonucleotide monophosphatase NagD (HAD superfamily)